MNSLDIGPRLAHLRRAMEREGSQVFVSGLGANTRYLTGSTAPAVTLAYVVVPLEGEPVAISSSLEEYRNRRECSLPRMRVFSPYPAVGAPAADPGEALRQLLKELGPQRVLSDTRLGLRLRGVRFRESQVVQELRQVKEPQELRLIDRAVRIANRGARYARRLVEEQGVGLTERQVANRLDYFLREQPGVQLNSFETIVGSGPLAAHSHHTNSDRRLHAGDPVICDFGVYVGGYCSDITRTYFAGGAPANDRLRELYRLVLEANQAGLQSVKARRACKTVDAACRDLLTRRGHGRAFVHGTGHGFGLEVHELPGVTHGKTERLQAGSTITIEPGLYLEGVGGVRIEDDVVVTGSGCRLMTRAAKDLY